MEFLVDASKQTVQADPCAMICNNLYRGCATYCGGVACSGLSCNDFSGDPIEMEHIQSA